MIYKGGLYPFWCIYRNAVFINPVFIRKSGRMFLPSASTGLFYSGAKTLINTIFFIKSLKNYSDTAFGLPHPFRGRRGPSQSLFYKKGSPASLTLKRMNIVHIFAREVF